MLARHDGRMFVERIAQWGEARFRPGASAEAIRACEGLLGNPLPRELRELLTETDGVEGEYGLGLVWSTERIGEDNRRFRKSRDLGDLYMPFDGLVFFSDAGNGDQFGVSLSGNHEIFVWDHEDDSRRWVAPTIMTFLEDWMTGRLSV